MGIPFRASPDAQGQGGFRTQAVVFLHDHGVELQLGVAGPEPVKAPFDALAVDVAGLTDGLDLQGRFDGAHSPEHIRRIHQRGVLKGGEELLGHVIVEMDLMAGAEFHTHPAVQLALSASRDTMAWA